MQFHWDRYGSFDENSSCWIRVSQTWAGSNYGSMHIPRIGQEVIVDFLNGDPDYPIITGRVYNAMQMPPWDLPANKTQSGIKTRSSKDGTSGDGMKNSPGTANALRFEDKIGEEQLWLHAQKDQLTEVEHDEDKWVGNDRRKTVDGHETNVIHKNRTETVDWNETITVHKNRTETVDWNETLTVHKNRDKTIDKNETDVIKKKWDITVGQIRMEKVGLLSTFNVGLVHSENVGLLHSSIVGGKRIEVSGVDKTEVVNGPRTTTVKSDTVTVEETQEVTAKRIVFNASEEILFVCKGSSIKLTPQMIQELANMIYLNCKP